MLTWWKRRRRRRCFSPLVVELPRLLARRYGGRNWYTPRQVEQALIDLRRTGLASYACAIACDAEGFGEAQPSEGTDRRRDLRREIAELFDLDEADLALRKLRHARVRSAIRTVNSEDWSQLGSHGGRPGPDGAPD